MPLHLPAQAQAPADPYRLKIQAQAVVLDVVVTDSRGHVVTGLQRGDFQVYEDNIPQTIRTFDPPSARTQISSAALAAIRSTADLDRLAPNAPVTLVILDEINTQFSDEAFARYSLERFLKQQGEVLDQPTLLGAVDLQHFTLLHDYTTSRAELLDALAKHTVLYPHHLEGSSWHAQQYYASFEGLLEATEATSGHPGHKSLLWVGRGFPPFDPSTLADVDTDGVRHVLEACTNAMRAARVVLYTLDPAGETTEASTVSSEGFLDDPFDAELDFSKMASITGGHSFYGRNDVDKLLTVAQSEGEQFYTLSYTPGVPITDTHIYRSIRVVMKNPNLRAETRTGYYAHPPASPEPVVGRHADRASFDLGLAAHSALPYDGVHMSVSRLSTDPDKFRLVLRASDLSWMPDASGRVLTKVTVIAEAFDAGNNSVAHTSKLSTLADTADSSGDQPADPAVAVITSVSTKAPAARVRLVLRDEATGRLGALSYPLDRSNAVSK